MNVEIEWDGRAIYVQIIEKIKRMAVRGDLEAGEKVLPVREMAVEMGVNPNTVARAYSELEREEILVSRRGMGTFVTKDGELLEREKEKLALQCAERLKGDTQELGISVEDVMTLLREKVVQK
jgi:GntR family transcriptional regulator